MVSSINAADQNRDGKSVGGSSLKTKRPSATDSELQWQKHNSDNTSIEPAGRSVRAAVPNGELVGVADPVAEWMREIKKVWGRSASSTLDLAAVVSAAKKQLQRRYGQWSLLWKSKEMPVSKRTADMLAVIGKRMAGLDSQTSANLPRGWNVLYQLARLDRQTLEKFIQQGIVHPKLTLREAKELVADQSSAQSRKANVRQWLRRFAEFVRNTAGDWESEERAAARETLTQLIEHIDNAAVFARMPNGMGLTLISNPRLLTQDANHHL